MHDEGPQTRLLACSHSSLACLGVLHSLDFFCRRSYNGCRRCPEGLRSEDGDRSFGVRPSWSAMQGPSYFFLPSPISNHLPDGEKLFQFMRSKEVGCNPITILDSLLMSQSPLNGPRDQRNGRHDHAIPGACVVYVFLPSFCVVRASCVRRC